MIIAVDGPAASGKGTLARRLAETYNLAYLDTGSLYRGVAYLVVSRGQDPSDQAAALAAARALDPASIPEREIRKDEIGAAASIVAAMEKVRGAIRDLQIEFAHHPPDGKDGAVLDGRDIGTVICPDADVKIFVDAAPEIRAKRRHLELQDRDPESAPGYDQILADLKERDQRDQSRASSPLKPAEDSHLLDTTNFSIESAFQAACEIVERARKKA